MKKVWIKRILCLVMAATLMFSATACAKSSKESEEPITLTAWYYADGEQATEGYQLWADQVHEAYPYITIEFEELPYDSGPEKFTVACATGATPDLYFDAYSRCAAAVSAGLTLDVTELRSTYADEFLGTQADGKIGDEYHAIITNSGAAYCIFVNMTMVKEAGLENMLPEDKLTWSYEEYLDFLRALKAAYPDVYPMELYAGSQSSDMWYYSWLRGNGVELTTSDLSATAFNTGANRDKAIETLNLFKTVIDEELCNPGAATTLDVDGQGFWKAGKSVICHGAYSNTSGWYVGMQEGSVVEFEYEAFAMPTAAGTDIPVSGSFGSYGFIGFESEDANRNDAILKAIEVYITNPECQTMVTNCTGRLSVMADTVVEWATESIAATMAVGASYSASYTDSSFGVLEGWWTEFRGTFYPNLQDFYSSNIDAGTLLDKWQSAGDEVIANAGK